MRRGVGIFPILVRLKRVQAAKRREMFLPLFWLIQGHVPSEIFQNIALRLSEIAFSRDIFDIFAFTQPIFFKIF